MVNIAASQQRLGYDVGSSSQTSPVRFGSNGHSLFDAYLSMLEDTNSLL